MKAMEMARACNDCCCNTSTASATVVGYFQFRTSRRDAGAAVEALPMRSAIAGAFNTTFPPGIHDHQNNSFDEFSEGGYAHAHHEELPPRSGRSVGNFSFLFSADPK